MRKYGKWVLTLGLLTATPGLTLAAGAKSSGDDKPAADSKKAAKSENQQVADSIAAAMRSKRVQGDIKIEYKGGVAILQGSVADAKMKEKATAAVSKVKGVSRVDNRLVAADQQKPEQKAPERKSATERMTVADAKPAARPVAAPQVPAAPRNQVTQASARAPEMAGGVVSANHTAPSAKPNRVQQVNAEYAAAASGPSNQEVAEQIGAALTAASLDGYDIQIRFQNGVCLLDGSVGTQAERASASRVVSTIPGVRSVANRLSCTQEPAAPAQRMAQAPMQGQPGQPMQAMQMPPQGMPPQGMPAGYRPDMQQGGVPAYPAAYRQGDAAPPAQPGATAMPMTPGVPAMPPSYGYPGMGGSQAMYNNPSVPDYAWPAYAQYPNSAAVAYPQQYSASAWPYIGPFYPYPQVPLGWRDATLRWDDGQWNLMFRTRTDKWWWYLNPNNW